MPPFRRSFDVASGASSSASVVGAKGGAGAVGFRSESPPGEWTEDEGRDGAAMTIVTDRSRSSGRAGTVISSKSLVDIMSDDSSTGPDSPMSSMAGGRGFGGALPGAGGVGLARLSSMRRSYSRGSRVRPGTRRVGAADDALREESRDDLAKGPDLDRYRSSEGGNDEDNDAVVAKAKKERWNHGGKVKFHNAVVEFDGFGDANEVLYVKNYKGTVKDKDPTKVVVRVDASTVSRMDTLLRRNRFRHRISPPYETGCDMIGTVVRTGSDASRYGIEPGQRVCAIDLNLGGNSRYVVVRAYQLVPVPKDLRTVEVVCLLRHYMVAYQSLFRTALDLGQGEDSSITPGCRNHNGCAEDGCGDSKHSSFLDDEENDSTEDATINADSTATTESDSARTTEAADNKGTFRTEALKDSRVLIVGASGCIGRAAVQLAIAAGASEVNGTVGTFEGRELMRSMGAEPLPREPSEWLPSVEGRMDVVIDPVCSDGYQSSYKALNETGRLVCIGDLARFSSKVGKKNGKGMSCYLCGSCGTHSGSGPAANVDMLQAAYGLPRATVYDLFRNFEESPDLYESDLRHLFHLLRLGLIRPAVSKFVPLHEVAGAHEALEEGGLNGGTIVCLPFSSAISYPPESVTKPWLLDGDTELACDSIVESRKSFEDDENDQWTSHDNPMDDNISKASHLSGRSFGVETTASECRLKDNTLLIYDAHTMPCDLERVRSKSLERRRSINRLRPSRPRSRPPSPGESRASPSDEEESKGNDSPGEIAVEKEDDQGATGETESGSPKNVSESPENLDVGDDEHKSLSPLANLKQPKHLILNPTNVLAEKGLSKVVNSKGRARLMENSAKTKARLLKLARLVEVEDGDEKETEETETPVDENNPGDMNKIKPLQYRIRRSKHGSQSEGKGIWEQDDTRDENTESHKANYSQNRRQDIPVNCEPENNHEPEMSGDHPSNDGIGMESTPVTGTDNVQEPSESTEQTEEVAEVRPDADDRTKKKGHKISRSLPKIWKRSGSRKVI